MRPLEKITLLCTLAALAYACDSDTRLAGPGVSKPLAVAVGVPFTQGLARPAWQATAGPGQRHPYFARGEAVGRQVGSEAIARAMTDGLDLPWTGTVPVGPGLWFSSAKPPQPPVNAQLPGMRPFFLTSADQFRPSPPPAFGSPPYLAALAEVRNISASHPPRQRTTALSSPKLPG